MDEIIVFGRNTDLVGVAQSASQGSVGGADLLIRPLFKTAELLESMPGMVAVQHSGSGKANQYFLRGFNLDHGTDYSRHCRFWSSTRWLSRICSSVLYSLPMRARACATASDSWFSASPK